MDHSTQRWLHIDIDSKSLPDLTEDIAQKRTHTKRPRTGIVYAVRCPVSVFTGSGGGQEEGHHGGSMLSRNIRAWLGRRIATCCSSTSSRRSLCRNGKRSLFAKKIYCCPAE